MVPQLRTMVRTHACRFVCCLSTVARPGQVVTIESRQMVTWNAQAMRTQTAVRGSVKMQPMKAGRPRLVSGVHAVSFRTALALAVGCFCAAVLMVAASSGPVEVWHEPPPSQGSPPLGATPQTVVLEPIEVAEPLPSSQDVTDNNLLA